MGTPVARKSLLVGREPTPHVSVAQRARLVVAMGLLNLVLATVALTAGVMAPTPPPGDIAAVRPTPSASPRDRKSVV